jgi:hypothetical protein
VAIVGAGAIGGWMVHLTAGELSVLSANLASLRARWFDLPGRIHGIGASQRSNDAAP